MSNAIIYDLSSLFGAARGIFCKSYGQTRLEVASSLEACVPIWDSSLTDRLATACADDLDRFLLISSSLIGELLGEADFRAWIAENSAWIAIVEKEDDLRRVLVKRVSADQSDQTLYVSASSDNVRLARDMRPQLGAALTICDMSEGSDAVFLSPTGEVSHDDSIGFWQIAERLGIESAQIDERRAEVRSLAVDYLRSQREQLESEGKEFSLYETDLLSAVGGREKLRAAGRDWESELQWILGTDEWRSLGLAAAPTMYRDKKVIQELKYRAKTGRWPQRRAAVRRSQPEGELPLRAEARLAQKKLQVVLPNVPTNMSSADWHALFNAVRALLSSDEMSSIDRYRRPDDPNSPLFDTSRLYTDLGQHFGEFAASEPLSKRSMNSSMRFFIGSCLRSFAVSNVDRRVDLSTLSDFARDWTSEALAEGWEHRLCRQLARGMASSLNGEAGDPLDEHSLISSDSTLTFLQAVENLVGIRQWSSSPPADPGAFQDVDVAVDASDETELQPH